MEEFHGDAILIGDDTEGTAADLPAGHGGDGIAALLPDGRGLVQLLEIVPEEPTPEPDAHRGEPAHRHIQSGLEHLGIHFLGQSGGETEYIAPVLPQGGGIDLRRVVQPHPPELLLPAQVPGEEGVNGFPVLPVLRKAVEQIGVPPLRVNDQLAAAPGGAKGLVYPLGVAEQQLVPAYEDQAGWKACQVPKEGRGQRSLGLLGIAPGIEGKLLLRKGHIPLQIGPEALSGQGQVRPGGDGNDAAGEREPQLLQPQAQAEAQAAAGAFAAETDFLRGVALVQQISVALQSVLQRRRKGGLRGQTIGGAEDLGTGFVRQSGPEAQGVVQAAAGVAAAVEIQDHSIPPQVFGQHPGTLKVGKIVAFGPHLAVVGRPHQFPQGILPPAGGLQGAVGQHGLHVGQLLPEFVG